MIHELRTPINHIVGYSELLLEEEDLPAELVSRVITWVNDGGLLIFSHWDLDVQPEIAAALEVSTVTYSTPRPVYHVEGTVCSIEEFFGMVSEVSGVPPPRWLLPYRPAWLLARALERLHLLPDPVVVEMASRYWGARSLHAGSDLGYKARDPRETLRDTVSWLRDHAPTA